MDRLSSSLLALFNGLTGGAPCIEARPEWRRHFERHGVPGTFVLFRPLQDRHLVFDEARARRRFLPASTFQVALGVIGLETGAIADEREVFRWDGTPKPRGEWERDQTLASAMREGAAWTFQEVARRVGKVHMAEWLERLEYGNRDAGGGTEHFWLQGSLRVSAFEQAGFLHKLAEGRLAATQRAQRLVREAMVVEKTRAYTLFARTGTSGQLKDPVAWWVGWIERRGRPVACFALNFTPKPATPFAARFEIARAILEEESVLE